MKLPPFILSLLVFLGITTSAAPIPTPTPKPQEIYKNSQYGFSFHYPVDWKLVDNLDGEEKRLELKSPEGLVVWARASQSKEDCSVDQSKSVGTDSLKIMGQSQTIYLIGSQERQTVMHANMALPKDDCKVVVEMYYPVSTEKSVADFKSADYETAKQIISSLSLQLR